MYEGSEIEKSDKAYMRKVSKVGIVISSIVTLHPWFALYSAPILVMLILVMATSSERKKSKIAWVALPVVFVVGMYVIFYFTLINPK